MPPKSPIAKAVDHLPLIEERVNFKINLLSNPNYYGTYPGLGNAVSEIQYNTTYEDLACLGLNPGTGIEAEGTLETVIQIKLPSGYDSGPCSAGSTEWVRFYVQNGANWTDLGVAGVTVYNLSGSNFPVSYAVSIDMPEVKKFCTVENVVNVRAILSWSVPPPANTPDFIPVWGNAINAQVQVAPAFFEIVPISSLVASGLLTIDPVVESAIDLSGSLPVKAQQSLSYAALKKLYANTSVPSHRFGFTEAQKISAKPLEDVLAAANAFSGIKTLPESVLTGADLSAILGAINEQSGNTTFEELTCAGYNPETRTLEAVIAIKLDSGYNGGLCTAGSYEYVSFYAQFGGGWNALGSAQVNVHDLAAITPGNPVNYAVVRVSALTSVLCENLTSIPLRAILSWEAVPTGPDYIPVWGNVLNTNIQPQISDGIIGEGARILRIGDVGVEGIQSSTKFELASDWLANPTGVAEDCNNADDSPFGGTIGIEGAFTLNPAGTFNAVTGAVVPGAHPVIYQAFITPPSGPKFQLTNQFGIGVFPVGAPISDPEVTIQQIAVPAYGPVNATPAPSPLFYTYYESADGQLVNPRVVAYFLASGLAEGNYTVEVDGYAWDGSAYQPMLPVSWTFYVYNGYLPGGLRPQASLGLTSAADCGNITVGAVITGNYSVTDEFFGSVTVAMTQIYEGSTPIAMPTVYLSNANDGPESVIYEGTATSSNTGGVSGIFTIYTGDFDPIAGVSQTPLPPCGYTIQLTAWDRALVNTTCSGHYNQEAVGFCLVAANNN